MTAVAERPGDTQASPIAVSAVTLREYVRILRQARLDSVHTSADSFLCTAAEIEAKSEARWAKELRTMTWAVMEVRGEVRGIAVAKPPCAADTAADPRSSRFIESVWIAPTMRRRGLGEHLVSYLIETQRQTDIRDFFLWVFDQNRPAIDLYERLGFKMTGESKPLTPPRGTSTSEIQYKLEFKTPIEGTEFAHGESSREQDRHLHGAHYRLLK